MITSQPPEGVDLSFDTLSEGWSTYKTKDDVQIKMRIIVTRIVLADVKEDGTGRIALGFNLLFAVTAPPQLKGLPSTQPITPEQIASSIVEPDVPYDTVREDWNEYDAEGVKVGVKPIATIIAKSKLFDAEGNPVYNVNYQTVSRFISKPGDKARFKKIWEERRPAKTTDSTKAP
jgi:hypothetical protein